MDDMIASPSAEAKLILQSKISVDRPTSSDQNLAMSYAIETPTSQLWLSSRRDPSDATRYTAPGEDRILSYTNLKLALNLVPLLWSRFALLFWQGGHRARLLAFALSKVLKGFLPAAKIWASSALLDEVQASFGAGKEDDVDQGKIIRLAISSLIISAGNSILDFLSTNNNVIVKHHVDHQVERLYMSSQLSLDIPTLSDPTVSALIYEAGCFAGFESRTSRPGMGSSMTGRMRSRPGAFLTLSQLLNSVTLSVEVVTASALLFRTLSTALEQMQTQTHEKDRDAVSLLFGISTKSVILLVLCFLPSVLSLSGTLFSLSVPLKPKGKLASPGKLKNNPGISESESHARRETGYEVQHMKALGKNGKYKQEVVLFGLKEWILTKWEGLVDLQMETEMAHRGRLGWMLVSFRVSEEAVQTAFLALLALRSFGTSISLGSIRLYQSTASSLLGSLRSLTRSLQQSVQSLFYMAAFFEAIDMTAILEEKGRRALKVSSGNVVDYETTRLPGGMRIEARNLGFTYPGQQEPVLRDINLVVEPGSTVAIVGLNGGGKTTLVKVLMGLYDHTGDLLINGHPAEAFPSKQLHARTTCCFQDHGKYQLTLQENIGIGNVDMIDSRVDIDRAIVKGGAESVRDRVGLGGKLDDVGVPKVLNETVTRDVRKADDAETRPSDGKPGTSASLRFRGCGKGSTADSNVGKDTPASSASQRTSLSGGQWQRVALARAFLRADDADLVVFDEPSASLDPQAEQALFKRVHALSSGEDGKRTTTIFISHRIQTVRRADKIVVVENGTIIESGPHDALMAMKGRYAEFFNLQREGFD